MICGIYDKSPLPYVAAHDDEPPAAAVAIYAARRLASGWAIVGPDARVFAVVAVPQRLKPAVIRWKSSRASSYISH